MSNIRVLLVLVVALLNGAGGVLLACGDKWLVPSRAARYELTPAARGRARLLIYANPASATPALLARLSIDPALRKAGYQPTSAATNAEFNRQLQLGTWDVVLVDLADGLILAEAARPSSDPAVVAVASSPTTGQLAEAKKQSVSVLKSPTRSRAFVEAIDFAVAAKRSAQNPVAKASR